MGLDNPTPIVGGRDGEAKAIEMNGIVTTKEEASKQDKEALNKDVNDNRKSSRGWPSRPPFYTNSSNSALTKKWLESRVFWGELTWQQKIIWRRAFVGEYLKETKRCLPHIRKLFWMIFRISPWRAIVVFAINIVSGLLPALTLQTRGNFIWMVLNHYILPNMQLQQGLEKKTLNTGGLLKLFMYQLLETVMDRITNEIMLTFTQFFH